MSAVPRHKTALTRTRLSRPVRLAIEDRLLTEGARVLDYGCGRGGDVQRLKRQGYTAEGWDPVHRPAGARVPSDIVNLGYVINVIENPTERADTLRRAWDLAERLLIVAARLEGENDTDHFESCGDGLLTGAGTFQKFYQQSELRSWLQGTLDTPPVPAAPGVFYLFRDDTLRQQFIAARYRRQTAAPRIRQSDRLFEQHKPLLDPLMAFLTARGRLPATEELTEAPALIDTFGTLKRAFQLIRRVTGDEQWTQITADRADDLRVHLALMKFDGRPPASALATDTQLDVKAFFGTYGKACRAADELLYALGDLEALSEECADAEVGKKLPTALYVHHTALPRLSPMLRTYEGCARQFLGAVEGATIIKLNREKPQVSYLSYPTFDKDPHPALAWALTVNLQTFRIKRRDFRKSDNPPILHRKELFVAPDYPGRDKFARLTTQEERWGLYEAPSRIGTSQGWACELARWGAVVRGHRLTRSGR